MKKLKLALSSLVVLALVSGLFVRGLKQNKEITRQEFLFDTLCTVTVYSKSDADALDMAYAESTRIHQLADFYRSDSDISKINSAKSGEAVPVDPHIMNMLILAQEVFEQSDGAFDITVAPLTELWGFKEATAPPADSRIKAQLGFVDGSLLVLDQKNLTVTKKANGTRLDLGGIAKGYAADRAAEILKSCGIQSALIDFGGNIVTLGENPKTKNRKWRIGLQTPFAPTGEYSKIVEVEGGKAIVTSGTYQRYFQSGDVKYHHILDPKTGYPSNQAYNSVTVVADSAAKADCLATAIFVMGEDAGKQLAAQYGAEAYFLP